MNALTIKMILSGIFKVIQRVNGTIQVMSILQSNKVREKIEDEYKIYDLHFAGTIIKAFRIKDQIYPMITIKLDNGYRILL